MTQTSDFEAAARRINEIAEELANGNSGSTGKTIIELRKLCGHYRTVPTSYKLERVEKGGEFPKRQKTGTEIWKGRYDGGDVALKILRVPPQDLRMQGIKSRFCKEVVLMKQLGHDNILPFYGVSTTDYDFCMVFPWYENGNIMDYLKKKPDADKFDLLSGAARGLRFLHENRLVHGALRPSHVLIDGKGKARLSTGGRSSIVAVPNTSIANHMQSGGEIVDCVYTAPEMWSDDSSEDVIRLTKENDVYGMGMVIYEVLAGNAPYSECKDTSEALGMIENGGLPPRPSNGISGPTWSFLERCWSRDPTERPSIDKVCKTLSQPELRDLDLGKMLTGRFELQVQSIKISLSGSEQQQFSVKLSYGGNDNSTSSTPSMGVSGEHEWINPGVWFIEPNVDAHGYLVSLEVLRTPISSQGNLLARGDFSLINVDKHTDVKLKALDGSGSVVLKISLKKIADECSVKANKLSVGNNKSSISSNTPSIGGNTPSVGGNKPSVNGNKLSTVVRRWVASKKSR